MSKSSIEAQASAWARIAEEASLPPENEIKEAVREANQPNAKLYTHEEVMQAMQERIALARDKPC